MRYTKDNPPPGAHDCWARLYEDTDRECQENCQDKDTCRAAFLEESAKPKLVTNIGGIPVSPPLFTQPRPQPVWGSPQVQQPMPPPVFNQPQPVYAVPQPQPQYAYQQPAVQYQPFVVTTPVQHSQAYQPQAYSFIKYPNESVGTRLAKQVALKVGSTVCRELANFLDTYPWPPAGVAWPHS